MRATRCAFVLLLLTATAARAQRSPLDRADSLLNAGQYEQARLALVDWQRANPPGTRVDAATRARALFLSARLVDDGARAHELYLSVALSYPTAPEAPQALLKLGQGLLASNDPRRALPYLERLTRDYPSAPDRSLAYLWLARAQLALGAPTTACATLGTALRTRVAAGDNATLIEAEEDRVCNASTIAADSIRPVDPAPPVTTPPPPPVESVRPRPSGAVLYAAQAGAYRNHQSAHALAAQLRRGGFDARVAFLQDGTLALVRIGIFRTWGEANAQVRRVRDAGFPAIIVEDVQRER